MLGPPPPPPLLALVAAGRVPRGLLGAPCLVPLLAWALESAGVDLPSPPATAHPTPVLPRLGGTRCLRDRWMLPLLGGGGGSPVARSRSRGARGSRSAAAAVSPAIPPPPHSSVGPLATAQTSPPPPPSGWDSGPSPRPRAPSSAVGVLTTSCRVGSPVAGATARGGGRHCWDRRHHHHHQPCS